MKQNSWFLGSNQNENHDKLIFHPIQMDVLKRTPNTIVFGNTAIYECEVK